MADYENLVKAWSAAYTEEVLEYANPPEVRDEEVSYFALVRVFCRVWPLFFFWFFLPVAR